MPTDFLTSQTGSSVGAGRHTGLTGIKQTTPTASSVSDLAGMLRTRVRILDGDVREAHEQALDAELDQAHTSLSKLPPAQLLDQLNGFGFAWRDVARMISVSVPAIQKWRRGEKMTGENRLRLSRLAAAISIINDRMLVSDVASWFEMPLKDGVAITPIDLASKGRLDLLFELAAEHSDSSDILDQFQPEWRTSHVDTSFETFIDNDGVRAIRPRR